MDLMAAGQGRKFTWKPKFESSRGTHKFKLKAELEGKSLIAVCRVLVSSTETKRCFNPTTGFSMMPSVQLPSQGAGHTRPVNSGKLLVSCSRSSASFHRPCAWPYSSQSSL